MNCERSGKAMCFDDADTKFDRGLFSHRGRKGKPYQEPVGTGFAGFCGTEPE
jgi:hypothetical protein